MIQSLFARVLASPFEFLALGYILNYYIKVILKMEKKSTRELVMNLVHHNSHDASVQL